MGFLARRDVGSSGETDLTQGGSSCLILIDSVEEVGSGSK